MRLKPALLVAVAAALVTPAWSQSAAPPPLPAESPAAQTVPPAPAATAHSESRESTLPWARIEQVKRGNRVVEVRITGAAGEHRYTMVNREGRPPLFTQELSSGLSTPRFFTFEF